MSLAHPFIVLGFLFYIASFLFAGDEGAIAFPIPSTCDVFHIFDCACALLISLKKALVVYRGGYIL